MKARARVRKKRGLLVANLSGTMIRFESYQMRRQEPLLLVDGLGGFDARTAVEIGQFLRETFGRER